MNIQNDHAVRIHYHLTDSDGVVIDSSLEGEPMAYLHGHGNLVPGVERALDGQTAGAKFSVVVPPEDGYGVPDPALNVAVPFSAFPEENRKDLVDGAMFHGPHPADDKKVVLYTVVGIDGDELRCTANHPLSGVTLHFDLEVIDVRDATEEELAHGHIHGPGGHDH